MSSCGLWEETQLGPSLVCAQWGCIWSSWLVCATSDHASTNTNGPDYCKNVSLTCSLPKHKTNSDCKWTTKIYVMTKKTTLKRCIDTFVLLWFCFMPILLSSADLGRLIIFPKRERGFSQKCQATDSGRTKLTEFHQTQPPAA